MEIEMLSHIPLFQGLQKEEISSLLSCLGAYRKTFQKDEILLRAGAPALSLGLVLQGSVHIVTHSYWGTSHIWGHVQAGEIFGEAYALLPEKELPVDVIAAEAVQVLFLHIPRHTEPCARACSFHTRSLRNLLQILARKNQQLSARMIHTASRSIRGRLLSYLSEQAASNGSSRFAIPFTRQQLADYLGVDRSALSHELSKMRQDGLISFRKNTFELLGKPIGGPW